MNRNFEHAEGKEFYTEIDNFQSRIYYQNPKNCNVAYYKDKLYYVDPIFNIVMSDEDGTNVKIIIASDECDWMCPFITVNNKGIFTYRYDGDLRVVWFGFDGKYKDQFYIPDEQEVKEFYIYGSTILYTCHDVSNAILLYDMSNSQKKRITVKNGDISKISFDGKRVCYYRKNGESSGKGRWYIYDMECNKTICLSCSEQQANRASAGCVYDYSASSVHQNNDQEDVDIIMVDLARDIMWIQQEYIKVGETNKEHKVYYWEPRRITQGCIPDMPIWKSTVSFGEHLNEYFDGINHYVSETYCEFEAVNVYGERNVWTEQDSIHGECDSFFVLNRNLYLNKDSHGLRQYPAGYFKPAQSRKGWFDKVVENKEDSFDDLKSDPFANLVPDHFDDDDKLGLDESDDRTCMEDYEFDEDIDDESITYILDEEDDESDIYTTFGELRFEGLEEPDSITVEKAINATDVKYKICTCGTKMHIGFGKDINIKINGKEYKAKMHSSAKGRIDRLSDMYKENDIKEGDVYTLTYDIKTNTIVFEKNKNV